MLHCDTRLDDQRDEETSAAIDRALNRLEAARRTSANPPLADFLPPGRDPLRRRVLAELVKVDQEYRWNHGQRRRLEEYLAQWPDLEDDQELLGELLEAECLTRALAGDLPTAEELQSRFPEMTEALDLIETLEATTAPPPKSAWASSLPSPNCPAGAQKPAAGHRGSVTPPFFQRSGPASTKDRDQPEPPAADPARKPGNQSVAPARAEQGAGRSRFFWYLVAVASLLLAAIAALLLLPI